MVLRRDVTIATLIRVPVSILLVKLATLVLKPMFVTWNINSVGMGLSLTLTAATFLASLRFTPFLFANGLI